MKFSTFLQIYLILLVTFFGYGVFWAINDNTAAIREQTKAVSGFNLIQAPERIAEIVHYEQKGKDIWEGNTP